MKKVFMSMPMRGKGKEEIVKERERLLALAADALGEEVELVESYFGQGDYKPLECLGESLKRMAGADFVVFGRGWEDARGCRIEHMCTAEYVIPILVVEQPEETVIPKV